MSIFFVKYPNIVIKTLIRRQNLFTPPILEDSNGCESTEGYLVPESKCYTIQSKIATFASSIPQVVFNLGKVVKHQWIELFCFLINNKFIYFKEQQQELQRRVWITFTKPQMPYGLAFIRLYFVGEQFYHPNQEDTSHSYVHKIDSPGVVNGPVFSNSISQTKIGWTFQAYHMSLCWTWRNKKRQ